LGAPLSRVQRRRRLRGELALAATADRVIAVSQRDARCFAAAGLRDVRVVTHGMAVRRDAPGPDGRHGLLFVGALDPGTPNEDGLAWFVGQVMPLLPDPVVLSIAGECRSNVIVALESPRVRLLGRIDDLRAHYDAARVFIAPARFAAGVAAKVIEAACHGLPVAASVLLTLQLGWSSGREIAGASDAAAFAAAIRRLIDDDDAWCVTQQLALARAAEQFDLARFGAAVRDAVTF
ncbi:MAG: glycosyltransferase, partial [Alphaproteobacteria bacterium]|nr:glycosyltransferase [Alphaproteobacteria bacterium]